MGKTFQVIVDGVTGRQAVDVANTEDDFNETTVLELKAKLIKKMPGKTDPSEVRVIYGNEQVEDTQKLSDCGIKPGSLVMAILLMDGGKPRTVQSGFRL